MSLENFENSDFDGSKFREEVYSKSVRAGKRTYFFDVKVTRKGEYYLTITESKRKNNLSGSAFYEKHKIFLYREDFEKFTDGLSFIIDFINEKQPLDSLSHFSGDDAEDGQSDELPEYSDIDFDDLTK